MEMKRSVFVALLVLIAVTGAIVHLRADEARTLTIDKVTLPDTIDAGNGD